MQRLATLLAMLLALGCGATRGDDAPPTPGRTPDDIAAVLHRSQQLRLDALASADPLSPRARRLRDNFDALTRGLPPMPRLELRIVRADIVAETLQGHIVVVNESIGDWPQGEQLFVLGHELGHVLLGHWAQLETLYRQWIPGPVTRQHTDAVAGALGHSASALAHRHEHEADAFALRKVCALGGSMNDIVAAFMRTGARNDTPTHPATRKRVAALRSASTGPLDVAAPSASSLALAFP
jgi:Peptidase family M48